MLSEESEQQFTYPWFSRVMLYAFVLVSTPLLLFLAAGALAGLVLIVSGSPVEDVAFLIGFAFGALVLGLLLILFVNAEPNIRVSNRGVAVQSFLFWYVLVPWQDIKEIRKTIVPYSKSYLVVVRRLTPFHRLLGWTNGYTFQPAFVIRRSLIGHDKAVKIIKENAGKLP